MKTYQPMLSFHNDPAVKAKYVARVMAHAKVDKLVQGTGWENGHGCAVGCTLEAYDHSRYPIELGLPEWLAHLEDALFEGMPKAQAMKWPARFLKAIPVGVDVESVQWQLAIWRHTKQLVALDKNSEPYALEVRAAIKQVIAYCEGMLAKTFTDESARSAAASAARSAAELAAAAASAWSVAWSAWSVAWSAAESARLAARLAESASWSAAESARLAARLAESAAESAAESVKLAWSSWSAAESARLACSAGSPAESAESAESVAEAAAYIEEADMLIKLLEACK